MTVLNFSLQQYNAYLIIGSNYLWLSIYLSASSLISLFIILMHESNKYQNVSFLATTYRYKVLSNVFMTIQKSRLDAACIVDDTFRCIMQQKLQKHKLYKHLLVSLGLSTKTLLSVQ